MLHRQFTSVLNAGYHTATVVFSLLGKSLICIAYSVVYVFGNEIFPTEVRNVGVGTAIMGSHVTSMTAAYVGGPMVCICSLQQMKCCVKTDFLRILKMVAEITDKTEIEEKDLGRELCKKSTINWLLQYTCKCTLQLKSNWCFLAMPLSPKILGGKLAAG